VRADVAIPYGEVSRDDVAATIAELIEQLTVNRIIIELTSGSVPVAGAAIISTAARCGAALSFRGADAEGHQKASANAIGLSSYVHATAYRALLERMRRITRQPVELRAAGTPRRTFWIAFSASRAQMCG
jgi:hypothetical protein